MHLIARFVFGLAIAALLTAEVLSQSPPVQKPPGSFLAVDNTNLYYEDCNPGAVQTVILVHDGGADSSVWDDVWPALCKRFHTIRYDRRGFGRSPEATQPYYETDDFFAILAHLKVTGAIVIGSSHGGQLSMDFALDHPEVVQQLILVGPVVSGMPYTAHFLSRGDVAFGLLRKGDRKGAIAEWSKDKYLIAPGNDAARKRLFDILTANPQDMTHNDLFLAEKPALPRLHDIHVPTLIVIGTADIPDVHVHAGAIEAGIPNARLVVIENVGHLMYLEKPEEFSRTVIGFIDKNTP